MHSIFRVVDGWKVRAAVGVDVPTGALEESNGGILQTAFGNTESQLVATIVSLFAPDGWLRRHGQWFGEATDRALVAYESVASTTTRNNSVSLSQSVAAETTRRRLPLVSPFIHSFCACAPEGYKAVSRVLA